MKCRVKRLKVRLAYRKDPALGNPEVSQVCLAMHRTGRPEFPSRQPRMAVEDRPQQTGVRDEVLPFGASMQANTAHSQQGPRYHSHRCENGRTPPRNIGAVAPSRS